MQPLFIAKNLKKVFMFGAGLCCMQIVLLIVYSVHKEHCHNICKVIQVYQGSKRDSVGVRILMGQQLHTAQPTVKAFVTSFTKTNNKTDAWTVKVESSQNTRLSESTTAAVPEPSPINQKTRICSRARETNTKSVRGKLNLHLWYGSCGYSIDDGVRKIHHFPRQPHVETTIGISESEPKGDKYSQRVLGYLHPEISGTYQFAISSDDSSELWLSKDDSTQNVELIAFVGQAHQLLGDFTYKRQFDRLKSQISKKIRMFANRTYYMEVIHRQNGKAGHLTIAWRQEGVNNNFVLIEPRLFSPYFAEGTSVRNSSSDQVECIMDNHPTLNFRKEPLTKASDLDDIRDNFCHEVPTLEHKEVANILQDCPYSPTYLPEKKFKRQFEGVLWVKKMRSAVYPNDHTWFYTTFNKSDVDKGNPFLGERDAEDVVEEYVNAIIKYKGDRLVFNQIINVERKTDQKRGDRFLVELELMKKTKTGRSHPVRLSEYVYKFKKEYIALNNSKVPESLCYPQGLQWRRDVKVHFVVTVKNMGPWIKFLIDELCDLYQNTPEKNFHLVVVDFNSSDFSIDKYLSKSVLKDRYNIVQMSGVFFKTAAYNAGVATVKDPNSIVFLTDLHLTMPANLIDNIRKHTIKGISAYFPLLLRLHCGSNVEYPRGGWENQGYGLLGIYKEDWDRMGGMNTVDFKDRWGGEDWDLLDRAFNAKLEPERLCLPKLYHFHHDRKGDWYNEDEVPLYEQNMLKSQLKNKMKRKPT